MTQLRSKEISFLMTQGLYNGSENALKPVRCSEYAVSQGGYSNPFATSLQGPSTAPNIHV